MVPCLSHFPSLCLEAIFKNVPLADLLRSLGLVCTSFHTSRHTDLNRRHRLILESKKGEFKQVHDEQDYGGFLLAPYGTNLMERIRREDGTPWHTLEPLELFQFDVLTPSNAFWTGPLDNPSPMDQLPNITHLVLILDRNHLALPQMVRAIGHYREQLVDLKLYLNSYGIDEQDVVNLLDILNRAPSLRHVRMRLVADLEAIRPALTFLSRLESFAIEIGGFAGRVDWILTELARHHNGTGTVELVNIVPVSDLLRGDNTRLAGHCFRSLHLSFDNPARNAPDAYATLVDEFGRFCGRFNSLTILELSGSPMPLTVLARHLSQLRHLVKLFLLVQDPEFDVQRVDPLFEQRQIAQVPSVRLLFLVFYSHSHHDTEQYFIADIFPNLQVLRLWQTVRECTDCGLDHSYSRDDSDPRVIECKRLSRQVFRHCPHLHTIQPSHTSTQLISADEL